MTRLDIRPGDDLVRSGRRARRWWILGVVVTAVLVVFIDGMVLNVALPRIQEELGASQSEQEWAVAAYTLVFAALLLPFGVAGDRFGRRRVLAAGLWVFFAGSLAVAYADTPTTLIGMRAAMGAGAAAILPATLAIITNAFDDDERGRAIAIWAATSGWPSRLAHWLAAMLGLVPVVHQPLRLPRPDDWLPVAVNDAVRTGRRRNGTLAPRAELELPRVDLPGATVATDNGTFVPEHRDHQACPHPWWGGY